MHAKEVHFLIYEKQMLNLSKFKFCALQTLVVHSFAEITKLYAGSYPGTGAVAGQIFPGCIQRFLNLASGFEAI